MLTYARKQATTVLGVDYQAALKHVAKLDLELLAYHCVFKRVC